MQRNKFLKPGRGSKMLEQLNCVNENIIELEVSSENGNSNDIIKNTPSPRPIDRKIVRPINTKSAQLCEQNDNKFEESNIFISQVLSDILNNVFKYICHLPINDRFVSLEDDLMLSDDSIADPDWKNPEELTTVFETNSDTETVQQEVIPPKKIKTVRWHKRRMDTFDRNAQRRNRSQCLPYKNYRLPGRYPDDVINEFFHLVHIYRWLIMDLSLLEATAR
ncbi:hypothetical protein ACJJTC_015804 [Scirpophaga incertulas]